MDIEQTLRALGVTWLRKVRSYGVATMVKTLKEAMRTAERGLKVIIADGECQLARQRRVRAEDAEKLKRGQRVVRTRYGVDDEICTGDHSCIRLSGCPSLTVKPNPDPLRTDPVATVIESCVGCGLCGEVAHAAVLCPSFYRVDIVQNPNCVGPHAVSDAQQRSSGECRAGRACWREGRDRGRANVQDASKSRASASWFAGTRRSDAGSDESKAAPAHAPDRGAGWRGRRRAHQLDRGAAESLGLPGAVDLDPGRGAAHWRDHLLHRIRPAAGASAATGGRCWRSIPASATST